MPGILTAYDNGWLEDNQKLAAITTAKKRHSPYKKNLRFPRKTAPAHDQTLSPQERRLSPHQLAMYRLAVKIDARMGIPETGPTMTAVELREWMRQEGIRPEDNIASRDIIRHRYPDDEIL